MNGILKQMKKIKHALAVMLCMALLLEGTGMQVLAETTSDVLNDVAAVSDVENASSGGTTDGGTIDGEEDEPESDAPVMASGNYCEGVTWTLYEDGLLVVKGTAVEGVRSYTSGWRNDGYPQYIKNAKVRVKGVASLSNFFYGCYNLETVDFTGSDTSNVTNMSGMFSGCTNLYDVKLSCFDTENVANTSGMFNNCYSLENLDLSSFSLPNVTNVSDMLDVVFLQTLRTPRNLAESVAFGYNGYRMYDENGEEYTKLPVARETSIILNAKSNFLNSEEGEQVLFSGKCCASGGITWSLTNKGHLTIKGSVPDGSAYVRSDWKYYETGDLSPLIISAEVDVEGIFSFGHLFYNCSNLESVDMSGTDISNITDVADMFYNCYKLESIDMSEWDISNFTDMDGMFFNCYKLKNVNIDGMKLSNVTDMSCLFYDCYNLENIDVSDWNTSKVTHMNNIFWNCIKFEGLDLSKWDTSNVTELSGMFEGCSNLKSIDLSGWDTNNVTDLSGMFEGCSNLKSIDLSGWDTSNVTDLSSMFLNCRSLQSLNLGDWKTCNVKDMDGMFWECRSLQSIDVSSFDTSSVTDMSAMFSGCSSLQSLDLSDWETCNATNMYGMLYGCNSLQSIDVSSFDTSSVTNMSSIFSGCSSLQSLDLSDWNTSNVKDMSSMFSGCSNLQSMNMNGLDTNSVTNMNSMYMGCSNLESLDLSNFDTSNVTNMGQMFLGCSNLQSLNLSSFITSNVTRMTGMFANCINLQNIDLHNFDTSNVTDMSGLFQNCSNLQSLNLSSFNTSSITNMSNMFYNCSTLERLDLSSFDMSNITSSMWNWVNSLENLRIIKTPKNLSSNIRIGNLSHTMYDKSGNAYTTLPTDLAESITLVSDMSIFDELEEEETPSGDVTGGDVTGGDVTGGDVSGGDTPGGSDQPESGDTSDGNDKPEGGDTPGGNDKPEGGATNDGNDKPEGGSTNDGNDQPEGSTNDGNDKPEGGDATDTNDGDDKTEDDKEDDNTGDSDTSEDEDIPRVLAIEPIADQFYTGKALKPEVIVTYGKDVLSLGKDYTVSYKNNINAAKADSAKAPVAIVKGKGNFEGTITVAFNIIAKELTESNTDISEMLSYENGTKQTVKPVVKLNGKKLTEGKDFAIEYSDLTEGAYEKPGTYSIVIKGVNNYQGSIVTVMTILSENQVMASKLKVGKIAAYDYKENEPATPAPAVSYKGKELVLDKDYSISYRNNDRAGKATLIITGLKNTDAEGTYVAGTLKKTFTIKGTPLKKAGVNYEQKVNYTGVAICPTVALTMDGKELVPGKDYTVAYAKNVNVGKATIILTGQGGYTGTVKKTFTIQADASVADKLEVTFAGGKAEASYSAKGAKPAITVTLGDAKLKLGKDYTVSYKNNKKLAEANAAKAPTVIIKGKGNYKFTKNVTFAIVPKNLADADMSIVSTDKFVGSKKGYISAPVIKDENGKKLKANKDYTIVGYTVNGEQFEGTGEVAAGTVVTVTVQGKDNYTGTAITTYRVANNDISKTNVNKPQLEYNGGKVKFTEEMLKEGKLEITDKATGKKLVYGTDFIVIGYKNNTKKGTATVTVQGIGEYGGTKNVKFSIVSKKLDKK